MVATSTSAQRSSSRPSSAETCVPICSRPSGTSPGRHACGVEVRVAHRVEEWHDAAQLLFAYQRDTAVELGQEPPACLDEVWAPVRGEVADPATAFATYLVAYGGTRPVGGVALVAHDAVSLMLKRCFVVPEFRRRGVATALVATADDHAQQAGALRLVLDILASRLGAIAAWQRLGFVECQPWADTTMRCFERPVAAGQPPWAAWSR